MKIPIYGLNGSNPVPHLDPEQSLLSVKDIYVIEHKTGNINIVPAIKNTKPKGYFSLLSAGVNIYPDIAAIDMAIRIGERSRKIPTKRLVNSLSKE